MKDYIEERAVAIANYIIDHNATVRQTAKKFGISKSTVHQGRHGPAGVHKSGAGSRARIVLNINKSERHIRGGHGHPGEVSAQGGYLQPGGELVAVSGMFSHAALLYCPRFHRSGPQRKALPLPRRDGKHLRMCRPESLRCPVDAPPCKWW